MHQQRTSCEAPLRHTHSQFLLGFPLCFFPHLYSLPPPPVSLSPSPLPPTRSCRTGCPGARSLPRKTVTQAVVLRLFGTQKMKILPCFRPNSKPENWIGVGIQPYMEVEPSTVTPKVTRLTRSNKRCFRASSSFPPFDLSSSWSWYVGQ